MDENDESPPQRPVVSREFILEHRRRRLSDALAEMCTEQGFRETTVAHIAAKAGTSRNSFYELFSNREEAFMTMFELGIDNLFARIEAGCAAGGDDAFARVEGGLAGAIDWIVERPHEARACLVDAAGATTDSLARQNATVTKVAQMLKEAAPSHSPRPEALEEYLVGGVQMLLRRLLIDGEVDRARDLLPDLSALLLTPYLADGRRRRN